tara:strand:- start:608 stop:1597 length:990 start_codon:yes stop_codon:yes gene_type:complete
MLITLYPGRGKHYQTRNGRGNTGNSQSRDQKYNNNHNNHRSHSNSNDRNVDNSYGNGHGGHDSADKNGGMNGSGNGNSNSNNGVGRDGRDAQGSRLTHIDQCRGRVYSLCKDQYGCRFLQKQLDEETDGSVTELIFEETRERFVDLMTDPFGNYLCQKLLEHCTDEQRLALIEVIAGDLVSISKNMHGTRAVQTTIEHLCTQEHVQLIVASLKSSVVQLIQDLNGNHVIQRCLHCLTSKDNQFIYDAVASHCVDVATHRHGCCVFQRCIDHGSDAQKLQLVREITENTLKLVRDPYGNYVVQYVLDLPFKEVRTLLPKKFKVRLGSSLI